MVLTPEEAERDCSELIRRVRRVNAKFAADRKKWWSWDKSELLSAGYSPLVVAKVKEYEARTGAVAALWPAAIFLFQAFHQEQHWWLDFMIAAVFGAAWDYKRRQNLKMRFSHADNFLVRDELLTILHNEKERAILWRLDAFLSGKTAKA